MKAHTPIRFALLLCLAYVAMAHAVPSNDDIHALLAERFEKNGVGIVVGVIEPAGRRVVAYGRSGAAHERPLDGDTIFQIGSVTKVFTGLLLADMIQRGEVKLDDPAAKYLPRGVHMPERGRPITLVDLATHMSGLPSMPTNFDVRGRPDPYAAYTPAQLNEFLNSYTPEREPGAKAEYSNLAFALLGRLLAQRAGTAYETLLRERVLTPLGLHSTAIHLTREQNRRLAPGHDRYLQPVDVWEMRTLQGSGSLRSSANDLLQFLAAYLEYENTPLKGAMAYHLAARYPTNARIALGWNLYKRGDVELIGKDGGKEGYRSVIALDLKARTGIVILSNARTQDRMEHLAMYWMADRPLQPLPTLPVRESITLDRKALDACAGLYRLESGKLIEVARKDSYLLAGVRGGGAGTYFPAAANRFVSNTDDEEILFERDAAGRVSALVLRAGGKDSRAVPISRS